MIFRCKKESIKKRLNQVVFLNQSKHQDLMCNDKRMTLWLHMYIFDADGLK